MYEVSIQLFFFFRSQFYCDSALSIGCNAREYRKVDKRHVISIEIQLVSQGWGDGKGDGGESNENAYKS